MKTRPSCFKNLLDAGLDKSGASRCASCNSRVNWFFVYKQDISCRHRLSGNGNNGLSAYRQGEAVLCPNCSAKTGIKPDKLLREFKEMLEIYMGRFSRGFEQLELLTYSGLKRELEELRKTQTPLVEEAKSIKASGRSRFVQDVIAKQQKHALSPRQVECLEDFISRYREKARKKAGKPGKG